MTHILTTRLGATLCGLANTPERQANGATYLSFKGYASLLTVPDGILLLNVVGTVNTLTALRRMLTA